MTCTTDPPNIGILARREMQGTNSLNQLTPALDIKRIDEAFGIPFQTDAHFCTYFPFNAGVDIWPRFNKPVLPQVRMHGYDLHASCLVLDYDNAEHKPWRLPEQDFGVLGRPQRDECAESFEDWLLRWQDLCEKWSTAGQWSAIYSTTGGARVVYVLSESIPVDVAEEKCRWLCAEITKRGITIDPTSAEWNRIFRLPFVRRGESRVPTWEPAMPGLRGTCTELLQRWDRRLDPGLLERMGLDTQAHEYADIRPYAAPIPNEDDSKRLLEVVGDKGQVRQTEWLKLAKKRLKGLECYPALFEHQILALPGARDQSLHRLVGQTICHLFHITGTSPEHIFAIWLDPVMQLDPDPGQRADQWIKTLWDHVCRLWAKEDAKARAAQQHVIEQSEAALDVLGGCMQGMKQWCKHPDLVNAANAEKAYDFAHRYFIVSYGNNFSVMTPNGFYDHQQLLAHQVIPRIRELGMDGLIQTQEVAPNGMVQDVSLTKLLKTYGTVISEVLAEPALKGAYIKHIGKPHSSFVIPCYRRNPWLEPTYNEHVDEWLKQLFGMHYMKACEWIAWALAFEEGPICSLSIEGEPGSGKQMFIRGLTETLEVPAQAGPEDLVGNYQYGLLRSPFLVVNEGWPNTRFAARHPADQFRSLVSGDPVLCNRRYMHPVKVVNPVRVIFTANNSEVIKMLTGNRNLSPEDREALAIRLLHFRTGEKAAKWLRARGGMKFTGAPNHRWVASQGDNRSDYLVAKHFLWLHKMRSGTRGSRFLVEGNFHEGLAWEMRTQSGSAPVVIETLIGMIESNSPIVKSGVRIVDPESGGRLLVLTSEILKFFRNSVQKGYSEKLTAQHINQVLRGLVVNDSKEEDGMLKRAACAPQGDNRHWHEIDPELLQSVARRDGWSSPCLDKLVTARQNVREALLAKVRSAEKARVMPPELTGDVDEAAVRTYETPVRDFLTDEEDVYAME